MGIETAAPVVAAAEVVAAVEVELPHVLAHGVAPNAAARSEADVVIDAAIVHERARPEVSSPWLRRQVESSTSCLRPRRW